MEWIGRMRKFIVIKSPEIVYLMYILVVISQAPIEALSCFASAKCIVYGDYSWIAHQLEIGTALGRCYLWLGPNFKSGTSFGFLSQDYTGNVT